MCCECSCSAAARQGQKVLFVLLSVAWFFSSVTSYFNLKCLKYFWGVSVLSLHQSPLI